MNKGVANPTDARLASGLMTVIWRRSRSSTTWASAGGNWIADVQPNSFQGRRRRGLQPLSRDDQALFKRCYGVNTPARLSQW